MYLCSSDECHQLCEPSPLEKQTQTHFCVLIDNNETNYFQQLLGWLISRMTFRAFDWTITSASLWLHVSVSESPSLDQMSGSGQLEERQRSPVKQQVHTQIKSQRKRQCGNYGYVIAVSTADLWDGLDLLLGKIRTSFVPGLGAWRLMAGLGLSLAPQGFGVETGLERNGWEQRIMREICLKSNHWL